ncbi:Z1 domain-containing protein [Rathayibacter sp. ZW T2_19]|uniref:Z1 domain-containing protein n=1 Tax=Rathayibacter rubneri TaxID=2950106 RepID=A0A9X2DYT7_9MICO|nr:Z1 domain-containing protein [Rathayibacter rubneri]MCM6763239.1 Z1 domain-containing protein [Rathayibacter rubneri]
MFYGMFALYARQHGVEAAAESMAGVLPAETLTALRERFDSDRKKVQTGGPVIIAAGRPDWYPGPTPKDKFWNALYDQFQSEGWNDDRLLSVNRSSDKVVAHTERPDKSTWGTRGLVVGYVQSGKTTNFLATAAKMADLEYGLIIVLSGIHNALRKQTQMRLEEALARVPAKDWFRLTELDRDFRLPSFDAAALLSGNQTGVAVVKKNASVLRKLKKWLETDGARTALKERPMLVIDDEADQASVETNTINPLITDLLKLASKSTYIGYTATPFANVFINPYDKSDLYPRDFILSLPRPDGYFGPEKIFGRDVVTSELGATDEPEDGYDMVRIVPDEDVAKLRPGTKDAATFVPELTEEFADALDWFWLATAARRARGDLGHSSMLVHTTVKTSAHEAFRPVIEEYQAATAAGLRADGSKTEQRLRSLWERESARVPSPDPLRKASTFDELLPALRPAVADARVVLDNFRSTDRLDYNSRPSQVVIAVGGNTLSRGLTLEGLVVSFFVRAASAYDTLMQMGRWFGYRTGYEELPRIWMTEELQNNFRHLSRVEYEMRDDIDRFQREDVTPEQAAVRISTHPALRITAKMGAASPQFVSFEGRRFQTRYFHNQDPTWLKKNLDAATRLLGECDRAGLELERGNTGARLFRHVPSGLVQQFLSSYSVHSASKDVDPALMSEYIARCVTATDKSLSTWSVAIVESPQGREATIGNRSVRLVTRGRVNDKENPDRADIKTLMSKEDRVADLHLTRSEARRTKEEDLRGLRDTDETAHREGLLVLYFIDPEAGQGGGVRHDRLSMGAKEIPVGLGIVFPSQSSDELVVAASKVSVDLSAMEIETPDDRTEGVDEDTETESSE